MIGMSTFASAHSRLAPAGWVSSIGMAPSGFSATWIDQVTKAFGPVYGRAEVPNPFGQRPIRCDDANFTGVDICLHQSDDLVVGRIGGRFGRIRDLDRRRSDGNRRWTLENHGDTVGFGICR